MSARRFPPPWTVEELDACFVVRDQNGQQLAYVYLENEPGRRSAGKLLSKDEARRIAADTARQGFRLLGPIAPECRLQDINLMARRGAYCITASHGPLCRQTLLRQAKNRQRGIGRSAHHYCRRPRALRTRRSNLRYRTRAFCVVNTIAKERALTSFFRISFCARRFVSLGTLTGLARDLGSGKRV